jgi:hypothetical protein
MRNSFLHFKKLCFLFFFTLIFVACQPTLTAVPSPTSIPTSTTIPTPISTPTLYTSPQLALSIPLSTGHFFPQTYKRANFSISFTEVRDLGNKVGGKLNFTEEISIKPEFQSTHHLIGIFITVDPPKDHDLVMRTGQVVINGSQSEIKHLDFILTPQNERIEPLGFCNSDLQACNGLGMPLTNIQNVFSKPSQTVRVFAVPNNLQNFTYYTLWDDPDYVK